MKAFARWLYYSASRVFRLPYLFPCRNYVFEVTYQCNLDCQMCSFMREVDHKKDEIKHRQEITSAQISAILAQIPKHSNVAFTGGEPFVKKGFLDVLESAKQCGHSMTIGTNGMLVDEAMAERILSLQVKTVALSIDGTRDLHNKIRRHPSAYDKVVRAVRILRETRTSRGALYPKIMVNTVIQPDNFRLLPEIVRIIQAMGADQASIEAMDGSFERSARRLQDVPDIGTNPIFSVPVIEPVELRRALDAAMASAREARIPLSVSPAGMTLDDLVAYYAHQFNLSEWECRIPWETCRISPYGDMYPCMNARIGNVAEKSPFALWNSRPYRVFRSRMNGGRIPPGCIGCCKMTKHHP